jgi:hypothetical protein
MFFLLGSMAHQPTASAGKKKNVPTPAFLSQKSLRGAMQGRSGAALDLNGDGLKDLVVGAPLAQHRGATGALLVYLATAKGFYKKPSAILRGDGNLGWSLVSLGDVNGDDREDFAAGAYSGNGEYSSLAGTVTIYYGGDKPQKAFVLEGEHAMDKFGFALAAGDLNDDGFTDLIVGAPLHSPSPSLYQQGAVYIYFGGSGPDYGPSYDVKISASNVNRGIGFSLAVGDISNDGVDDLLMGASGKVIGYTGGSGFPSTAGPDLVFSSGDRGFGRAISVIWDVDGDDYNDVAVGAYQAQIEIDKTDTDTGRLFILKGGEKNRTLDLDADPPPPDLLIRIDGELRAVRHSDPSAGGRGWRRYPGACGERRARRWGALGHDGQDFHFQRQHPDRRGNNRGLGKVDCGRSPGHAPGYLFGYGWGRQLVGSWSPHRKSQYRQGAALRFSSARIEF